MLSKTIQVHENEKLRIGEKGFEDKHFQALTSYNDKHGKEFFKVGHKHIQFTSFVGVIQVLDLTIEIMPKIDLKGDVEKDKNNLIKMLKFCKNVPLSPTENAKQRIRKSSSLLDLFFQKFLDDTETILHRGLKKKYLKEQSNLPVLKGKLVFSKHISQNIVHQEKFFTEHTVYNRNMILNQLLKKALEIIKEISTNNEIKLRAADFLLFFENVEMPKSVNYETFRKIRFTRHNDFYKEAMILAEMIILQYSPQISGGKTPVLAILFQMHRLFEEFVFRKIKKYLPEYSVKNQNSSPFWKKRRIRPDIIIEKDTEKVIMDTKWKILSGNPSDDDIQQMFVYCKRLKKDATLQKAFLVYPGEETKVVIEPEKYHECDDCAMGIIKLNLVDLINDIDSIPRTFLQFINSDLQ